MQFTIVAALFLATGAFAAPAIDVPKAMARRSGNSFCPSGLYSVPQCCATDVAGAADLDCSAPKSGPNKCDSFKQLCAADGKQARCCVLPVAGQALLCTDPISA